MVKVGKWRVRMLAPRWEWRKWSYRKYSGEEIGGKVRKYIHKEYDHWTETKNHENKMDEDGKIMASLRNSKKTKGLNNLDL